jgi:hypothetical protein
VRALDRSGVGGDGRGVGVGSGLDKGREGSSVLARLVRRTPDEGGERANVVARLLDRVQLDALLGDLALEAGDLVGAAPVGVLRREPGVETRGELVDGLERLGEGLELRVLLLERLVLLLDRLVLLLDDPALLLDDRILLLDDAVLVLDDGVLLDELVVLGLDKLLELLEAAGAVWRLDGGVARGVAVNDLAVVAVGLAADGVATLRLPGRLAAVALGVPSTLPRRVGRGWPGLPMGGSALGHVAALTVAPVEPGILEPRGGKVRGRWRPELGGRRLGHGVVEGRGELVSGRRRMVPVAAVVVPVGVVVGRRHGERQVA